MKLSKITFIYISFSILFFSLINAYAFDFDKPLTGDDLKKLLGDDKKTPAVEKKQKPLFKGVYKGSIRSAFPGILIYTQSYTSSSKEETLNIGAIEHSFNTVETAIINELKSNAEKMCNELGTRFYIIDNYEFHFNMAQETNSILAHGGGNIVCCNPPGMLIKKMIE